MLSYIKTDCQILTKLGQKQTKPQINTGKEDLEVLSFSSCHPQGQFQWAIFCLCHFTVEFVSASPCSSPRFDHFPSTAEIMLPLLQSLEWLASLDLTSSGLLAVILASS